VGVLSDIVLRLNPRVPEYVHILYVLKGIPQVADEGMVDMLQHASFANDVPDAFGSHHCTMILVNPCACI
jgi:hypothetical protein